MIVMVVAVVVLAALNVAFKAVGPAVLGDRPFPPRLRVVVETLPVALLAGLLVVEVLGPYWQGFDGTVLPGLVVGAVLRVVGRSLLVCVVAAVVCTAALRAVL